MSKEVKPVVNPNLLAYKEFHDMKLDWNVINVIRDKDIRSEEENKFLEQYYELINLVACNVVLQAVNEGYSAFEAEKWKEEFLLHFIDTEENKKKIRAKVDIGCPSCGTKLVFVKSHNAETSSEHACGDNGYVNKKGMYGCPNESCFVHESGLTWLSDGEGYYGGYNKGNIIHTDDSRFIDKNCYPFRTWHRKNEAEAEKLVKKFIIGNVRIDLKVRSKANENGKKHWNKSFSFDVWTRKNKKDYGWTSHIGFMRMFIFSMRQYANKWIRVKQFKNEIEYKDKRKYAVLSFNLAKIIWRKDYLEAVEKSKK